LIRRWKLQTRFVEWCGSVDCSKSSKNGPKRPEKQRKRMEKMAARKDKETRATEPDLISFHRPLLVLPFVFSSS